MSVPNIYPAIDQTLENYTPSPTYRSFAGIAPSRYQHPADRETLEMLQNAGGLDDLMRLFNEHVQERRSRVNNLANNLRVSERQMPGLHRMFRGCCERLGVPGEPELYLAHDENAWTSGSEQPYVVLGYPLLARMTPPEMEFVMAHELGHVLYEHVLYHQVARWALSAMGSVPVVGTILQRGLGGSLFWWQRMTEFSADRAGLLAMGDVQVGGRLLMKLAGFPLAIANRIDVASCMEQAAELDVESRHLVSAKFRNTIEGERTHPWSVLRAGELFRWAQTSQYETLVRESFEPAASRGPAVKMLPAADVSCDVCGEPMPATNRFCSRCGGPLRRSTPKSGGQP